MSDWFSDGTRIDSIPIDDRGAQYGDGLFETVAIRHGEPRFWSSHVERLSVGCERLDIAVPSGASLLADLQAAIATSAVDSDYALAKIIVTSGSSPRGYQRPAGLQAAVRIGIFASQPYSSELYRDGVRALLCHNRVASQPGLAGIKTLNRLDQVLARAEWNDPSITEGLMLDTDDRLICGTMSNVFIGKKNSISTPAITRCGVSGVMRRHVLSMLEREEIACEVRDIDVDELYAADEVFITNSQIGVLPVRCIDSQAIGVGAVARKVMQLAANNGVAECVV